METQVRTPQVVFMQPQRLIVPLFQRPYVWNEENQWEPLWGDVLRVAKRLLDDPNGRHQPHFLGAVVLQQVQNPAGTMQERTVIDGQQRLTTLQLLLDALHRELKSFGADQPAMRIETLVVNPQAFWERPEDRFKVWPTNRDRAPFNAVMAAETPVSYEHLRHSDSRLVQAHEYFARRAREWLQAEGQDVQARAAAVERAVRELMQMVVIDLTAEENAQEIFETLNARGAQLTAADLIKNFVFQRLSGSGVDIETAYQEYWKEFETGFWEKEVSSGRARQQRSSMFLNHWLIAKTGEEILSREVFYRFKSYADFESGISMAELLGQVSRAGKVYRNFVTAAEQLTGPVDRLGLFAYRSSVMESEVVKPLVLCLLDPEEKAIPADQVAKALQVVESWLVRRMLVRATTKSYTQVFAQLINEVRKSDRHKAGDVIEEYLRHQVGANWYWPDNDEVRQGLQTLGIYRRLSRARLRMLLEAIEDHRRGWRGITAGLGGERVARGKYAIEHIMPQRWQQHWPLPEGTVPADRDRLIHTLGNLTLLTSRLNSKVSNGPWAGQAGKRTHLEEHDVLMLNRELLDQAHESWNEESIEARTQRLVDTVLEVWPVPGGHQASGTSSTKRRKRRITLSDLMSAGLLAAGASLHPRSQRFAEHTAVVLPDGALDVNGVRHTSPSGAARQLTGTSLNGWWFWLVEPGGRRTLSDLWHAYVHQGDMDVDDEEGPDEEE
ncbi:GmrSD restriction endonuclease domain-containing protein [Melissospora conviva]|uniref:GmrSD restriction endonuclease domain-containing protein n=1 Tax=Melissospora conviva TaxID=3388432 RepID=UPI003C2341AF